MNASRTWVSVCVVVGLLAGTSQAVNIDLVTVGNPGNAPDTRYWGAGDVGYTYQMGKFEVTAGQYCEFLNAVAKTDTYGLYNTYMDYDSYPSYYGCNIKRSGSPGNYTYSVASDWANRPVNWVSWGDAVRFANWMRNGQPTGAQNASTTEDGSYLLNGATTDAQLMAVTRKANATWVIPSGDEWYKAAYYDPAKPGGAAYWRFAARSENYPTNVLDPNGTNNANYYTGIHPKGSYTIGSPYYRTEVGAFASSRSAYGTYDQGGNLSEWNEATDSSSYRGTWGGSFEGYNGDLGADTRSFAKPSFDFYDAGFRVSEVPEPATTGLFLLGGLLAARRRRALR